MGRSGAASPRARSFGPVLVPAPCAGFRVPAYGLSARAPEPVHFAPGVSSAELHGAVVRGERALHSIRARADQHMSLHISAVEDNAAFQVCPPGVWPKTGGPDSGVGGSALPGVGEGDDATHRADVLPRSGAYLVVVVVGPTRGDATCRLSVDLRWPDTPAAGWPSWPAGGRSGSRPPDPSPRRPPFPPRSGRR